MKAKPDAILQQEQAAYLARLHPRAGELLGEMEEYAAAHRVPIADREVGAFLEITARAIRAERALEIGMAIGYAALRLARALPPAGRVITIEPDDEMISRAEEYLSRAGLRERVRIEKGYALDVLPRLEGPFDLVYLDALKEEYAGYLDLSLPLLRVGGVVIADNLLWGGAVARTGGEAEPDGATAALREFNLKFVNHPQLLAEVLSVGDGLGYAVKVA